jgi:hypothetical protein
MQKMDVKMRVALGLLGLLAFYSSPLFMTLLGMIAVGYFSMKRLKA